MQVYTLSECTDTVRYQGSGNGFSFRSFHLLSFKEKLHLWLGWERENRVNFNSAQCSRPSPFQVMEAHEIHFQTYRRAALFYRRPSGYATLISSKSKSPGLEPGLLGHFYAFQLGPVKNEDAITL
jgi:hypothetical protein